MNIIEKELKSNLRECLNDCPIEMLKHLFGIHKSSNTKKISTKTEYIEFLSKKIPQEFSKYLELPFLYSAYKILTTYNKENNYNKELIANGFMFHYHYDDLDKQCVNVIPKELLSIFSKKFTKVKEEEYFYKIVENYIYNYLHATGYVPKARLKEIVLNLKEFKVTEEVFNRIISENKFMQYKDNYTIFPNEICQYIENNKVNYPYNAIDILQTEEYSILHNEIIEEILSILDIEEEKKYLAVIGIEIKISMGYNMLDRAVEDIQKYYNIDEEKANKIQEIINENEEEFRFWNINGSTNEEYQSCVFLEKGVLKNEPKNDDLKSCLEEIPKDGLKLIKNYYDIPSDNIEDIKGEILKNIPETLNCYEAKFLEILLEINNTTHYDFVYSDLFFSGIVFLLNKENGINMFIPKEIKEIINHTLNIKKNREIASIFVNRYLKENGIISIDTLLDLLNNNHKLDVSKEDLMDIIEEHKVPVRKQNILTYSPELDDEDIEEIVRQKKMIKRQHIVDLNDPDYIEDFLNEVDAYVMHLPENDKKFICSYLMSMIFLGSYDKEVFKEIFKMNRLEQRFKPLDKIAEKYKNKVGIWTLNGFNRIEFYKSPTKQKIGRNEPCICGSGKNIRIVVVRTYNRMFKKLIFLLTK